MFNKTLPTWCKIIYLQLIIKGTQAIHCGVGDQCSKHSNIQKDVSFDLCLHIPEWGNSPAWIQHKLSSRTKPLTWECLGHLGHPVKGEDKNYSTAASFRHTGITNLMTCLLVYLQLMELAIFPVVQLQLLLHCHTQPQAVLSLTTLLEEE